MTAGAGEPLLYTELAEWWPLLSHPNEYVEEARTYARLIAEESTKAPRTVLELGSGGGNNASHMKKLFEMTLVELSRGMLEVSRRLNPECDHLQGDMRSVRLDRTFDAVFVHDAISYITTLPDLEAVFETARAHLEDGGVAVFCPDRTRERFKESIDSGGNNDGRRGLRYLEWTWDPDPSDSIYTADYAFLMREADGEMRAVHDRHLCGLFAEAEWLASLRSAGFSARLVPVTFEDEEREWPAFVASAMAVPDPPAPRKAQP